MGGFHDILSKVISSIRRFVDHNIWSMRRLGDYDVWLTTTYRLKFVELRRNSSKFSRKCTRNNSCFFDCLEGKMLFLFSSEPRILFFTSASCRLGSGTTHDPRSGRHVVYLSKTYFLSKSTGNTREAVSRKT